jgi:hypothetical protein
MVTPGNKTRNLHKRLAAARSDADRTRLARAVVGSYLQVRPPNIVYKIERNMVARPKGPALHRVVRVDG